MTASSTPIHCHSCGAEIPPGVDAFLLEDRETCPSCYRAHQQTASAGQSKERAIRLIRKCQQNLRQLVAAAAVVLILVALFGAERAMSRVERVLSAMERRLATIQSDVSSVEWDVSSIQSDVSSIHSDVSSIESDVSSIESDVSSIDSHVTRIENLIP